MTGAPITSNLTNLATDIDVSLLKNRKLNGRIETCPTRADAAPYDTRESLGRHTGAFGFTLGFTVRGAPTQAQSTRGEHSSTHGEHSAFTRAGC